MVLGIAGGNGLEHIDKNKYQKVYGIDINTEYLKAVEERYSDISEILECIQVNLIDETSKLPNAELLVANLLIEYIGYDGFQKTVEHVCPQICFMYYSDKYRWQLGIWFAIYSCIYKIDEVHHQMEENLLIQAMKDIGYNLIAQTENLLPNGKKLVQLDFSC